MRSHFCGEINESFLDKHVELCGWVNRRRDHGGVIFIDLRDREGIVQVVFQPEDQALFTQAERLRNEYVIKVRGLVRARPEGMINDQLNSGKVEVCVEQLVLLNEAETPPFQLDEHYNISEDLRLRYRYLDIRRPEMQQRLRLRAKANHVMRQFLEQEGFTEIETPILMKATPEGARDYLVPSRTHRGEFFALPQSPQLFKQLLMMSGMERYYQIVRCFRDEDLRADRQPEFTQLDLEASFIDEAWIQTKMEAMVRRVFQELLDVSLPDPFPRMTYAEAMRRFGSDKPDTRIPLEFVDIDEIVASCDFKVFADPANADDGRVIALRLPKGCELLSRKQIDDYTKFVGIYGAKGLAYIKVNDRAAGVEGLQSPIVKFLSPEILEAILVASDAQTGDILFFGAGSSQVVNESMGALRSKLGHDLDLIEGDWAPLWVTDWPMFEKDDQGRWSPHHHPFTAPQHTEAEALLADPGAALAKAYDMVLNGHEIGGGSIRIHQTEMQHAVFDILQMPEQEINNKFGFLLEALKYGCPPHGGIAFGLDRLIMIMTGTQTIRDVIAFPKTQSANCLLTGAPSAIAVEQLLELGISVRKAPEQSNPK